MTIEKFYETLRLVVDLDRDLRLQSGLEAIGVALNSLVNSPAQPTQQAALAVAMSAFVAASRKLGSDISPSQSASIAEIGGAEFFDPLIAEKVNTSIVTNAMTPSVARDFVQDLVSRRSTFLETVKQTISGLKVLGVTSAELAPGTSDLAFVIPRELFENHLGPLAKELVFISRLVQDFSEAVTGEAQPAVLEGLSSSVPTIALFAGAKVVEAVANVVNKFLEAWERIEKIRRMRAELQDMGLKGSALDELTDRITTTVSEVIEQSTEVTMLGYSGADTRKNELENALRQDMQRLFGQIERGLTIQFRAAPDDKAQEDEQKSLDAVDEISRTMQFPQITTPPMLLSNGEVLEGDIHTIMFATKTTKTTVKKETRKTTHENS